MLRLKSTDCNNHDVVINHEELNIEFLPSGIYCLEIRADGKIISTKKLVKQQ